MANNDWDISLIGRLDKDKSRDQINQDINDIQEKLNDVEVKAKLGSSVVSDLEKQLNNLQVSLADVTIPQSVLDGLVNQINNALQGIQIGNINFNPSGVGNFGRQVGEVISDEVNNALGKITSPEIGVRFTVEKTDSDEFNDAVDEEIRRLQKLNNKMVSVRYTTNTEQRPVTDPWGNATSDYEHIEKLTGAVFRYNTETGEAITKTMKWAQIGTTVDDKGNDIPLMGWVQGLTSYNKSLEEATVKTDTFLDKQKQAVATAESKLSKIESELNDKNAPKTLANTDKVANGLNKALQDVRDQIVSLGSASRDTFAQAKIDTDAQIVALENLIKRLKNAEYVATSLRTKTFDTVKKDEINNFEPLYQELLKSTAVDKDGIAFSTRAENLHNDILGATSSDEITTFLNNLSNLKTEYRAVRKQADDTAKATGLLAKKSEALSSLHIFRAANPDVEKFQATVGGATLSVQDLENAINNASSSAELNAAKEQMKAFQRAAEDAGKATKSTATEYETLLKKANEAININKYSGSTAQVKTNYEKLDDSLIDDSLRTDYGQLISLSESLNESMSDDDKVSTYKELENLLPSVRNRITELSSAQKNLDKVNKIQLSFDNGHGASDYKNRITEIEQSFIKYGLSADEASKKTENLRNILNGFKDSSGNFLPADELIAQANKLETEFDAIKISVTEAKLAYDKFLQPVSNEKASSLIVRITNFISKNSAITTEAKQKLEGFVREIEQGVSLERWNKLNTEFKETEMQMRKMGRLGNSLTQTFIEGAKSFASWTISSASVMEVVQGLKRVYDEAIKLDDVMTDLAMSTDLTDSQMESLAYKYSDLGEDLNATTSDIIASGTEWIKQGQSIADTEKLITSAMVLDKVGKLENAQATEYLTSAMKGYKVAVEDTMDIVDKLSAVDMASATDVGGLAEAMSQVANNANLAGVSMDKLLGYIAVIGETTGEGMSSVGTGLNAIFSRMGNIKLARLKDYQNNGEDLNIWGITA